MSARIAPAAVVAQMSARYDRRAVTYAELWAPVLAPSARRVLDLVAPWLPGEGEGLTLLDLGTGSGTLARGAAARWARLAVVALDLSPAMLDAARGLAEAELPADALSRVTWRRGEAAATGLPTASIDVAVSSFVLQLVPDRPAAMREVRRVLRPGGHFAFAIWRRDRPPYAPADAFEAAVREAGLAAPDPHADHRAGDIASAAAAAAQLRRAGFEAVGAAETELVRTWTAASYLDLQLRYEADVLVASVDTDARTRLEAAAARRLAAVPAAAWTWRAPFVYAWGRRPR